MPSGKINIHIKNINVQTDMLLATQTCASMNMNCVLAFRARVKETFPKFHVYAQTEFPLPVDVSFHSGALTNTSFLLSSGIKYIYEDLWH